MKEEQARWLTGLLELLYFQHRQSCSCVISSPPGQARMAGHLQEAETALRLQFWVAHRITVSLIKIGCLRKNEGWRRKRPLGPVGDECGVSCEVAALGFGLIIQSIKARDAGGESVTWTRAASSVSGKSAQGESLGRMVTWKTAGS